MSRPLVFLTAVATLAACNSNRIYECAIGQSAECNRDGQQGDCLAPGFCAFTDSSCDTGLRWDSTARDDLAGQCVSPNGDGDGDGLNLCGGTADLDGVPGQRCGVCDSGTFACSPDNNAVICQDELNLEQSITGEGSVSASSVFSGSFGVDLAVDGDLGTSWFSAGSDTDGTESVYSWTGAQDRCITGVNFTGNEFHPQFPENFGFGQLTVEVRDASDTVVFSKVEQLPGTPDPAKTIDTGGVTGRSVHFKLQGHESSDCGGFAELVVNAKL